ncbi:MAG: hypothetical protein JW706_12065 [Opitutales bacterium]|nr:hypothetical protein [Opitutales bacterium]
MDQSHLLASVTGPVHTVTNSYESGRDVMTSKTNQAASGLVSRFGARYDALGRRVETNRSGSAFAQNFVSGYQYDLLGQLTKDERFAGATPGDPDQKLEDESFAFLYDGIGNRLSVVGPVFGSGDANKDQGDNSDENTLAPQASLLRDASGGHGPMSTPLESPLQSSLLASTPLTEMELLSEGSKRLEFKYDYIGRRVSKQVWTHTGGSWTDESTTAFVYDGWNLIEEIHSPGAPSESSTFYTWGLDLSLTLQGAGGVGGLLAHTHTDSSGSSQNLPLHLRPQRQRIRGPRLIRLYRRPLRIRPLWRNARRKL